MDDNGTVTNVKKVYVIKNGERNSCWIKPYALTISKGSHSNVILEYKTTEHSNGVEINSGEMIYHGGYLEITVTGHQGYTVSWQLNGVTQSLSNVLVQVTGNVSIVVTETANTVSLNKPVISGSNGQSTRFYLDGNKILGEDRPNCKLRYFYDVTGLKMIRRIYYGTTSDYYCVKDSQGSIVMLVGKDRYIACRYEYDALGNCTILYDTDDIGSLNPFRWKGFYLDSESGLYYANGSYYDPETMSYFDAQDISSIAENAFETRGLDRNGIPCDNTLALAGNASSVFTSVELAPNPAYDPGQTWWEKITFRLSLWWNSISPQVKVGVGIVLIAISIVIAGFTGGASVGFGAAAAAAAKTALIDLAIGIGFATVGWVISSAISGNWDINGLGNAVADAIFFTGVFFFVSTSITAIKHLGRKNSLGKSANTPSNYVSPDGYTLANRGHSIGKDSHLAQNINEQLAIESAMSNPTAGKVILRNLGDPRWHSAEGWVKMAINVNASRGDIHIHYVLNESMKLMDDFKIIIKR